MAMAASRCIEMRRGTRGFTMIEVLVALAIIAIALAASLRAVGVLAVNSSELNKRMYAGWSADNELARLHLTKAWPNIGSRTFDCSQGNLALSCTERVSATPNPIFRRVEVFVATPGQPGYLVQMVTVIANETSRSL
ncbi:MULTISPECIES: type II secretion system minor pseudopilin GspI [Burkholderiaceae]|uniref:type II secretion system minor pseudopilin GspI n=1 Tax=Burkholderiaceae TaxID=119060 RepID=UPI000977048B|nr:MULTISPECIES: type II secretion system minor pseudopilin GspI [Burkholderiaceae]MCF2132694.1 type II secretion system minor pseudopilin GspI [Mycetohabitans sp. B3]MCG1017301.1 type II secretion system minor pseudopilin GspI [Mycetohabitans sp. B4]MCG1038101.1 type II secretion system minor pseudopilin GspI [Mycetohabitans sp. B7]